MKLQWTLEHSYFTEVSDPFLYHVPHGSDGTDYQLLVLARMNHANVLSAKDGARKNASVYASG